jgi:CRISPR-associated protein Cmr4
MYLSSKVLFVFTESPLHAGTGSGLGVVDLPIQRERSTDYPVVHASGIKGALRSVADGPKALINAVFGPEVEQAQAADADEAAASALYAGALSPGDARLLLFPVRSLTGVFAWTTSLDVLNHFRRDARMAGLDVPELPEDDPGSNQAYVSGSGVSAEGRIVLEEFAFAEAGGDQVRQRTRTLAEWLAANALPSDEAYDYWRRKLVEGLVILPQDAYRDFVRYATEVVTRVRLEPDTKTVKQGALWTEEYLPSDALLYAPVHATRLRQSGDEKPESLVRDSAVEEASAILDWAAHADHIPHWLQIGGNETTGRGVVRLRWMGGQSNE